MPKKSFFFLIITVTFLWGISVPIAFYLFGKPDSAGTFGDMFGAINSLFSGLAFAGVIYAMIVQDHEIVSNQQQFQKTIRATEISSRLTAYSTLLQECDNSLQRYERWEASTSGSDYKQAKATVRERIKEYRAEVEKLAKELNT